LRVLAVVARGVPMCWTVGGVALEWRGRLSCGGRSVCRPDGGGGCSWVFVSAGAGLRVAEPVEVTDRELPAAAREMINGPGCGG